MKKCIPILLLTVVLEISALAQGDRASFETLTAEVSSAKTFEEVEQILKKAEILFTNNKKQAGESKEKLAQEKLGFALFRKAVLLKINPDGKKGGMFPKGGGPPFLKFYKKNYAELEKLFEDSIKIYEEDLKIESVELATAKFELAHSNESNFLLKTASPDWDWYIEEYSKNQGLYLDAFMIREKLLGRLDDSVIVTAYYLANSYMQSSDFEKALSFYESFISGYREKYGDNDVSLVPLVPALLLSAEIWKMVDDQESVDNISKEIREITNEKFELSETNLPLSPRASSFKYKGINPIGGLIINSRPTGVTSEGRIVFAGIPDIQQRSTDNKPSFRVITPGHSSIKIANSIKVRIEVDTEGNVVKADVETSESKTRKKVEKSVMKWKFRPFVYKEKPMTMNGFVYYYDTGKAGKIR